MKTILFQAPNEIGLGHINRLASIALDVRAKDPSARLLFAVEGGDHQLLGSLALPHLSLLPRSHLGGAAWAPWPAETRAKLLRKLAISVIKSVAPDLIVFDCHPYKPLVRAAELHGIPMVLCVRKVMDWDLYMNQLAEMVDVFKTVIFAHEPGEFELPARFSSRGHFVGEIVRPTVGPLKPARAKPGISRVVISGGAGGYDGTVAFYNLALEAVARARKSGKALEALLVTGPMFREWNGLALIEGLRITPFEADLPAVFADADAVICQAGYNTIAELAQLGVPAICVPAPRFLDDQTLRAEKAAASNDRFVVLRTRDPAELCRLLVAALDFPPQIKSRTPLSRGAGVAASLLLELVKTT